MFNGRDRGIWLCFSRKDFQLDSRTDKVLATVEDPSQGRNNEYNRKSNNTVVWIEVSYVNSEVKLIGTVTGLIFLIVMLFVGGPVDDMINGAAGPLLTIIYNATQNKAGAICLLM